jgi:7-cyano-7-deazaguanine synthase in queuosine biosynthesis
MPRGIVMVREAKFQISLADCAAHRWHDLENGVNFRLDEDSIAQVWCGYLPPLFRDLARVGTAVYVTDRLLRRPRRSHGTGRQIALRVDVSSPEYWSHHTELLSRILGVVSNDLWDLQFRAGMPEPAQAGLFPVDSPAPLVCLYSGGLDSAAGLLNRLREGVRSVVTVTACHQPGQRRRILRQLETFRQHYGAHIIPIFVRTTLKRAPALKHQELSQRCRSFLFLAIGGAVAATVGAGDVEVYESGVGVLNLPSMTGMLVGARATRSCHPELVRLMTELVSAVADRPLGFSLPFIRHTKSEVVRAFLEEDLQAVVPLTTSCVHYPIRIRGSAKQCGLCFACIGRRQALFAADVADPASQYQHDIFTAAGEAAPVDLESLRADLFQVARLAELSSHELPAWFSRHLYGSRVVQMGDSAEPWPDLMLRYRAEWLRLIDHGRERHLKWAELVNTPRAA